MPRHPVGGAQSRVVKVIGGSVGFHLAGSQGEVRLGQLSAYLAPEPLGLSESGPTAAMTRPKGVPDTGKRRPLTALQLEEQRHLEDALVWVKAKNAPRVGEDGARPWVLEGDGVNLGLLPGFDYVVGRDEGADIRVYETGYKGDTVSRCHATLGVFEAGLYLVDQGSTNGTRVGAHELKPHEWFILKQRTEIRFGKFVLSARPVSTADLENRTSLLNSSSVVPSNACR